MRLPIGTQVERMVFGVDGPLQSARTTGAHAIHRSRLRGDGTVAVSLADGTWQRWRIAQLVEGHHSLTDTGALSSLRVCRSSQRVVPVVPFPSPAAVWAPAHACTP
jgi:hypothetical protein